MNGKQLKNSILQWAIQGKLVPQNPNDEPASVLLEKIRAEKTRLMKEGKLKKKDLEVKPITEEEIPFEIPKGWKWCRLGDIGVFERGNGIKRDETFESGYPCVRYGEMYTKYKYAPTFDRTFSFTSKAVFEKCRKAHNGDLFMALTGENKQDISLAAQYIGKEEIAVGGDLCHFTVLEACALYFVYLINSTYFSSKKEVLATGDIIVHISTDKLASIAIPLPPLAEQRRIVAKIEELMPLVERYGKAQQTLDQLNESLPARLQQSILQEAIFGNHVGIQLSEIKIVKLKEICEIVMGQSPEGNTYNNSNGIEFHQGKVAFGEMFLKPSGVFTTSPTKYAEPNSIVVSVRAPVGTANITKRKICIGRGLACIKPKQNADLMYIFYLLESPEVREYLEDNSTGTTFKAISGKVLQELEVPLPPLSEQKRIVAKVKELFEVMKKSGK